MLKIISLFLYVDKFQYPDPSLFIMVRVSQFNTNISTGFIIIIMAYHAKISLGPNTRTRLI
jgi:hypothetical protein